MVNYLLMICADLDNLTDLQPQGGCDDSNFTYYFKVNFILTRAISLYDFCYLEVSILFFISNYYLVTSILIALIDLILLRRLSAFW